jgi:hypothetical protein
VGGAIAFEQWRNEGASGEKSLEWSSRVVMKEVNKQGVWKVFRGEREGPLLKRSLAASTRVTNEKEMGLVVGRSIRPA